MGIREEGRFAPPRREDVVLWTSHPLLHAQALFGHLSPRPRPQECMQQGGQHREQSARAGLPERQGEQPEAPMRKNDQHQSQPSSPNILEASTPTLRLQHVHIEDLWGGQHCNGLQATEN
eukprot:CAMPEP_0115355250 /NCGR_PEP_ID=MMETSP0270-20121206/99009_1 /TAXON_ID=71861 /ORGANISM="Scrippsiella trochoidea, Strain CCMP3099" /LENGTH=119 /DNA_ID=CAMNT_0002777617 /DNA_START=21 /DNA_END=380 /DNA_ORIENTATION=-